MFILSTFVKSKVSCVHFKSGWEKRLKSKRETLTDTQVTSCNSVWFDRDRHLVLCCSNQAGSCVFKTLYGAPECAGNPRDWILMCFVRCPLALLHCAEQSRGDVQTPKGIAYRHSCILSPEHTEPWFQRSFHYHDRFTNVNYEIRWCCIRRTMLQL